MGHSHLDLPDSSVHTASLALRKLSHGDAQEYLTFRAQSLLDFPEAFTSTAEEERRRPLAWASSRIQSVDAPKDFILGAFYGDRLVGTAGFSVSTQSQTQHKGLLFGMAVAKDVMGRGVGRLLVERLLSEARKIDGMLQVCLTVTDGNASATQLYESCGFTQFGREPRAVLVDGKAIAKIHMVRFLDDTEATLSDEFFLGGVSMSPVSADQSAAVTVETVMKFEQQGSIVSARYRGGTIVDGYLIGTLDGSDIAFRYLQIQRDNIVDAGASVGTLVRLPNGRLRLIEKFQWHTRPGGGTNIFEQRV